MSTTPRKTTTLFLLAMALMTASCSRTQKVEAQATKPPEAPTVAVVKTAKEDMSRELILTAEFRPFQEIEVMAKVAGYVKNINVDVGDRVQQGQLLAVLEIPEMRDDLDRVRASVDRSQAEVARAKDELLRAETSHKLSHLSAQRLSDVAKQKPGLVAQQEIDDAMSKDMVSEAQVSSARSHLMATEKQVAVNNAEVQHVRTMMEYARVSAPFAGVITKRYADNGSMLQAGTASSTQAMPLVRLSQNSTLRLILPVPESAVPTVHIGQRVNVRVPTLNRSFPGRVARFSEKVSLATRTMETEVDVPNPSLVLIPGMYAEVNLSLDSRPSVLAVPLQAVDVSADDTSGQVALVTSGKQVEFRKVKLGLQSAANVEVRSGLNEGDLVVVGSRASLRAGQQVEPKVTTAK